MSLQKGLETIEPWLKKDRSGKSKKSSKLYKKFRNKWLRKTKIDEIPNTKIRYGYEY